MRLKKDQRGFVLSGIALLLVLPAMMLGASLLAMVGTGGEAVSLQIAADKMFYVGKDVEHVLWKVWEENLLFDNQINPNIEFENLAENYRAATGLLVDITSKWLLWTSFQDKDTYGKNQCYKIARVSPDNWLYYFEVYQVVWDYDDLVLQVSKIDGENLKITIVAFDPVVDFPIDIYYENILLWDDARSANVGESKIVTGITQLTVSFNLRDPRDVAWYITTENIG